MSIVQWALVVGGSMSVMRPIAWAIAIVILRFSGARTVDEAASALRLARGCQWPADTAH